eukprot:TRINITY_DN981_c0_g1_i10.p3 TRINITY_DN981_c0_g1~~TRINITY_DN981_c0_g1_i10.p3  ORF type:complete len:150 (-),score=13.94 TRINITY_DN981_c0_g1_i10:24-473(-)
MKFKKRIIQSRISSLWFHANTQQKAQFTQFSANNLTPVTTQKSLNSSFNQWEPLHKNVIQYQVGNAWQVVFFLLKHFDDVMIYLKSIKSFFEEDDDFNWNYGITCAQVNEFKEAEGAFARIKSEKYRICLLYTSPSPRDRQKSRMPSSA